MIIIGNGFVVESIAEKKYIPSGAVAVEGGVVLETGANDEIKEKYPDAEYIDAKGGVITAGFIDAHTRLMSVYEQGLSANSFIDIQKKIRWKIDRKLTESAVTAGAKAAAVECIRNGITTAFDIHASYGAIDGSVKNVESACADMGINVYSSYEVSDRDGAAKADEAVKEAENGFLAGCDAAFNMTDETLAKIAALGKGVHISADECEFDENNSWKKYQMSVIERLDGAGVLNSKSIAAHCTYVSEEDIELLKNADANAVLCPAADTLYNNGTAPVQLFANCGVKAGIGTDGAFDMLAALKEYARVASDRPFSGAETALNALAANAEILKKITGEDKSSIGAGNPADIIVIGRKPIAALTEENVLDYIVYGAGEVTTTICGGNILMRDSCVDDSALDEAAEECAALYARLK